VIAIDNPILNRPFAKPDRHWALSDDGMPTGEINDGRRRSEYIVAVATSKRKKGGQEELILDDRQAERRANDRINAIRTEVDQWRDSPEASWGVTYETARLLKHWRATDREHAPVFRAARELRWRARQTVWSCQSSDCPRHMDSPSARHSGRPFLRRRSIRGLSSIGGVRLHLGHAL
jgi:hypothetical protein